MYSRTAGRPCWCVYGIGARQVLRDRLLQVLRRPEAERARVADVELDQRDALGLEFQRPAREFAADFIADFGQAFAGDEAVVRHGVKNQ